MKCPDGCGLDKPEISGYQPEETMSAKHTPTPWHTAKFKDTKATTIYAENGTASLGSFKREEDAEFSVRAVNSHEALLETLRGIEAGLQKIGDVSDKISGADRLQKLAWALHDDVVKAIAKAEAVRS